MTENTSSLENQSPTSTDVESLNVESTQPPTMDTNPSATPSSIQTGPQSMESSLCTKEEYEYEFSTTSHGQVMWVHLWDDDDLSACERVVNRPLNRWEISYSKESGNGFINDRWDNAFTFTKKKKEKRSFSHPDFGTLETDLPPTGLKEKPPTRVTVKAHVDVMDILNSL